VLEDSGALDLRLRADLWFWTGLRLLATRLRCDDFVRRKVMWDKNNQGDRDDN
jgi:hypothetical protein